jgi:hypothetical protein
MAGRFGVFSAALAFLVLAGPASGQPPPSQKPPSTPPATPPSATTPPAKPPATPGAAGARSMRQRACRQKGMELGYQGARLSHFVRLCLRGRA